VLPFYIATIAQLELAIARFRRLLDASTAVALFYFAGHGSKHQEQEIMLCSDWNSGDGSVDDLDAAKSSYGSYVENVIASMNKAQASIVLLDACRTYFDRKRDVTITNDWASGGFRALSSGVDTSKVLIGYSCGDGTTALDSCSGSHCSPYTTALLQVRDKRFYQSYISCMQIESNSSIHDSPTLVYGFTHYAAHNGNMRCLTLSNLLMHAAYLLQHHST
jgi:Caspase domain